jgi:hypothetical protein
MFSSILSLSTGTMKKKKQRYGFSIRIASNQPTSSIEQAGGLIGKSTQQIWKLGFEHARPKRSVYGNWAK